MLPRYTALLTDIPAMRAHIAREFHYQLVAGRVFGHSPMSLTPGSHLNGYDIDRQLGAGGMGVVYLAHERKLGRAVAIKVLSGEFSTDRTRIARFEQEARAASALSHPNVCVVHALGETPDGQPFIAMEYIEGHTLRHVLRAQPPTLREALDIAIQVAAGVGAAHALGIVHRDLKPENVLVRRDGIVKVVDFGLAKLARGLPSELSEATRTMLRTADGVVMGTFTYMAPEQARGLEVDARVDIWALGVMLYESTAGRQPFTGETQSDVLAAILDREPPPLDQVDARIPHELQRIVGKALRKDRQQRYQTITDLRLDLEALRAELQPTSAPASVAPIQPTPVPTPLPTSPPVRRESSAEFILTGLRRHKVATIGSVFAILALILAGAWWALHTLRAGAGETKGPAVQRALTKLTFDPGLQTDPTFSPDGRFIAYASDRGGHFDIWVQPVAGGDPVQVTKSPGQNTQPDWSPDGSTIVFRSERQGGGLYVVPALGGQERQLSSFGVHPKWSADGSAIFFLVGPNLDSGEGPARCFTIRTDGTAAQELGASLLSKGTWRWIASHPDGRITAAGTHPTLGRGFFTFTRQGGDVVKSTEAPGTAIVNWEVFTRVRFQWNGTGTGLYLETSVNGVHNLWRVQVDPATLAWLSADRLTTGAGEDVDAAVSRDGSRLAYAQRSTMTRLWSFPLDAAAGRVLGEGKPISEDGATVLNSTISPDGEYVAYIRIRPGARGPDLVIAQIGNQSTTIIQAAGDPSWSPDSRQLVYAKIRAGTSSALVVRKLDGGSERTISPFRSEYYLAPSGWTPDSRAIIVSPVFDNRNTPMWLWSSTSIADKPERVLLSKAGVNFWQGRVSPNGRWLVFVPEIVADAGVGRIAVAPADGAPQERWVRIASDSPWADKPRWSPDGRLLYFIAKQASGFFNLSAVRFDPERGLPVGAPFALTHFDSPDMAISPEVGQSEIGISAHRALLTMVTRKGSIWMLDNVDR